MVKKGIITPSLTVFSKEISDHFRISYNVFIMYQAERKHLG